LNILINQYLIIAKKQLILHKQLKENT
jgi:hypothetical protein